ncbi:DUF2075 domain-containing protein [Nocardia sp. NPDC059228]|uniref:DUF2075 domain-containing protein n=1 Tax=Nocardia sp. NPDC059228 TaxID=3346777 RepID=UPI0036A69B1D
MLYTPSNYGRMFTGDDRAEMLDYLRSVLDVDAGRDRARKTADSFLAFNHSPSKPLLQLAAEGIQRGDESILVDEQRVAYSIVMQAVNRARAAKRQTVIIVEGGPGSGKSTLALSMLGDLVRQGIIVHHATGSSTLTNTLRKVAGTRNPRIKALFKYFNSYVSASPLELDVLICDEAHRIRETSVNRFTRREARIKARKQVEELISAAWVSVFFIDESQIVRPGESGSVGSIMTAAEAAGCAIETIHLTGQFRFGGSDTFETWVQRLLSAGQPPAITWSQLTQGQDDEFRVVSASSPEDLEAWLRYQQEQRGGTARLTAGLCWPWSDPIDDEYGRRLVADVEIGNWRRPWNAKSGRHIIGVPDSYSWASDDRGFEQIGCIYTAQGFEYDWAGVIFGPDLVRRGDRWLARPECSRDPAVEKVGETQFEALILNTYKVLLTRGMRGVGVYSTDPETQAFLEAMAR